MANSFYDADPEDEDRRTEAMPRQALAGEQYDVVHVNGAWCFHRPNLNAQ